jgi:hypothetical protein
LRFGYAGYELEYVTKKPCRDGSAHQFTLIFKFYSPRTGYIYILNADYHSEDVFGIKFYVKQHRKSDFKYSKITNKGDLPNILVTCAKVVPILLQQYPGASFGFVASRSVDEKTKKVEDLPNNQRFQAYAYLTARKFGTKTFAHISYPKISSYLLLNRNCSNIEEKERAIIRMFQETYQAILDL